MQEAIRKQIEVHLSSEQAFKAFVNELALWWPKEYTWSKDKLVEISIDPVPGGHCTEKGPNDFRCDWGTVSDVKHGEFIAIKWQISPMRVPEPDPGKASQVYISFQVVGDERTAIQLRHDHFENHGDGHETYRQAMDSEKGWDYLLACFTKHARSGSGLAAEVKS